MTLTDAVDLIFSRLLRRPTRKEQAAMDLWWKTRQAQTELLVASGYRDWLAHPQALYNLREREIEFRRLGAEESFIAKPVYLHPQMNIADLWWRLPDVIPPNVVH
jgi:hypothetical protein